MILFEGALLPDDKLDDVLDRLWDSCVTTIEMRVDIADKVIGACGKIAERVKAGEYDTVLRPLLEKEIFSKTQMEEVLHLFDEENLRLKYDVELGQMKLAVEMQNSEIWKCNKQRIEPLGILFHIAAGNAEGLPFFSVLEGMMAGNINILKLPSMDDGLSVLLLQEMIKVEPELAPYVCVLDVPSTNLNVMKRVADMADAIVVWGGDEAIRAVRSMADPATQIISWGHKLSFAYVTPGILKETENEAYRKELYALARHICETRQVLCSSCQGIFVDTDKMEVVQAAAEQFLQILETVSEEYPQEAIGIRGKIALSLYNEELEVPNTGHKILRRKGVSVIVSEDSDLSLSYMFRNCWVKPLPRQNLVKCLKGKRGYLQTAGLICAEEEREGLTEILVRCGVTRIAHAGDMSTTKPGGAHDGEYPLRRYCRIVETE